MVSQKLCSYFVVPPEGYLMQLYFLFQKQCQSVLNMSNVSLRVLITAGKYKSIDKNITLPVVIRQKVTLPEGHFPIFHQTVGKNDWPYAGYTTGQCEISTAAGVEHYIQN